jgi:predicted HD superfamily hydrolase involved in NAD metabolism
MQTSLPLSLREKALDWLVCHVPRSRLEHILRVEETAASLAVQHSLNVEKAAQAGLMHDLAKCFRPQVLLRIAAEENLEVDDVFKAAPHLLHADVSAVIARREFGIYDAEVLRPIANHTLGSPNMDALSCVVFLADSLEPGRGNTAQLNHLRQISQNDLPKAVWMTCDYTFQHLLETYRLIHPRAILTRNWFLQSTKQRDLTMKSSLECSQLG